MLIKTIFTDYFFFLRDENHFREIKMSLSTQSKKNNLKYQITLYSDLKRNTGGEGVGKQSI